MEMKARVEAACTRLVTEINKFYADDNREGLKAADVYPPRMAEALYDQEMDRMHFGVSAESEPTENHQRNQTTSMNPALAELHQRRLLLEAIARARGQGTSRGGFPGTFTATPALNCGESDAMIKALRARGQHRLATKIDASMILHARKIKDNTEECR